jgi:hypothetical protein
MCHGSWHREARLTTCRAAEATFTSSSSSAGKEGRGAHRKDTLGLPCPRPARPAYGGAVPVPRWPFGTDRERLAELVHRRRLERAREALIRWAT